MSQASEATPLIPPSTQSRTSRQTFRILGVTGFAGFISSCSFWAYYVQWHSMLLLFGIPGTVESFLSDLFRFSAATLGILLASVYSVTHGKKRVLAASLLVQTVGSLLIVSSQSIDWLLLGQTIQYFGIAPIWSTSIGLVGEHVDRGARGKGIGTFIMASMVGAAVAPFLSSLVKKYVAPILSVPPYEAWRLTESFLIVLALGCWLLVRRLPTFTASASPDPALSEVASTVMSFNGSSPSTSIGSPSRRRRATSVATTITQAHARSTDPFEPLSLLRLKNVVALSFASGAPIYASLALLWMEVSQFGWSPTLGSSETITLRRSLPAAMVGMGMGALISGILMDRSYFRTRHALNTETRLLRASSGIILLPIGLVLVGFTLKAALNHAETGDGRSIMLLLLGGVVLSGLGAYSPVVPCITYFLDLVPHEKNVQILAASDTLQLLSTLPLLMLYIVVAQGIGSRTANIIAAVGVLYAIWLLWRVSKRSNELQPDGLETRAR